MHRFERRGHRARPYTRLPFGFGPAQAAAHPGFRLHVEVEAHLGFGLVLQLTAPEYPSTRDRSSRGVMRYAPSPNSRAMISAMRSQPAFSLSNCLRPAEVIS